RPSHFHAVTGTRFFRIVRSLVSQVLTRRVAGVFWIKLPRPCRPPRHYLSLFLFGRKGADFRFALLYPDRASPLSCLASHTEGSPCATRGGVWFGTVAIRYPDCSCLK